MAVLEVRDVSIRFGGVQALDGIDLEVAEEGEIVGILGPNGAGKTTLFNCISGFARPNHGRILLFDEDVTDLAPDARARRGLGRTFQQVGLVRSFTVLENLVVAQHSSIGYRDSAGVLGTPGAWREERRLRERAHVVLEVMDLLHLKDRPVEGMPYGTLKMVEVAAVLATDPRILMLDEPLAGTSTDEGEVFCDRLRQLRRELGLTIVMIDHHVPLVLGVADYVYVINFGRLLAEGAPEVVRHDRAVAEAYMGEGAAALA